MSIADTFFRDRRVLVTGGLGFIGSNLAHRLAPLAREVVLVDSLVPEYGGNLFNIHGIESRVRVNISDVRDPYSFRHLVQGADVLFNLAGQTSHLDSMEDPQTDLAINATAQLAILEACRRHNPGIKIVFASTRQVYGRPEYLPVDERHPLRPADVNGIHKLAAEFYHTLYHRVHGVRSCVLRLTNTVGPRMRIRDERQTFVGVWIRRLLEGEPIEVWGGEQLRDLTYVDDAVDALLLAAASDAGVGKVYNVGGGDPVSLKALAELLIELNGGGACRIRSFPPDRARIDIGDYYSDDRLFRGELAWRPQVSLRDGLARTLAYFRQHLARYVHP